MRPLVEQGADTLVLGCTHYPFVIPLIQELAGPTVRVIDPTPAVARQTARVRASLGPDAVPPRPGQLTVLTSGDAARLAEMLPRFIGEEVEVNQAKWEDEELGFQ